MDDDLLLYMTLPADMRRMCSVWEEAEIEAGTSRQTIIREIANLVRLHRMGGIVRETVQ